jgi:hypothetical protein
VTTLLRPLILRWHMRNVCFCCHGPAVKKCRTHGSKVCDSAYCRMEHRRMKSAVSGDLTRPFCEYTLLNTLFDHLLHACAVFVAGVAFIWVFLLLGVI